MDEKKSSVYDGNNLLARQAVKEELKKLKRENTPVARYDKESGSVYMEHSDGTRETVGGRLREGRYSEQYDKKKKA